MRDSVSNPSIDLIIKIEFVQMYYKNIFEDIVTSDFGKVSTIFER